MPTSTETTQSELLAKRWCEERLRLGLTQGQLAEALGISRTSATMYEAGKQMPGAEVLMNLRHVGADVLFILTGQRERAALLDIDRLESALEEARRQTFVNNEQLSQRQLLDRANTIYQAIPTIGVGLQNISSSAVTLKNGSPTKKAKSQGKRPLVLS